MLSVGLLFFAGQPTATGQIPGPCGAQKAGTIACLTLDTIVQADAAGLPPNPVSPESGGPAFSGNVYLVTPLTASQPLPSPASGFVYTFDSTAGVYVRSAQDFGPILSERSDTIGRKKLFLGGTFQRFVFDKLDGFNAHAIPGGTNLGPGIQSAYTVNASLQLNQYTFFVTYGLTDRLDVSLALPISTVHYGLAVNGNLRFSIPGPPPTIPISGTGSHTASGIGDMNLELKGTAFRIQNAALAVGALFRFPTGDEYEALGAGAIGVKPFVVGSITYKSVSPHVDIGYLFNGKSILDGNIITGQKGQIPDQVQYAAGADSRVTRWLTASFDVLGTEVVHGYRYSPQALLMGSASRKSYNMTNGSVGFKINPSGKLLVVANALFRLNGGSGLRTKIAPLIGLSYAF